MNPTAAGLKTTGALAVVREGDPSRDPFVGDADHALNHLGVGLVDAVVPAGEGVKRQQLPEDSGALAGVAAFDPASDAWLDALLAALDDNRRLLADLLAEHVPAARYRVPDAGFLAWVDLSALGWGDNPSARILREAKVAVNPGPHFGDEGAGHIRINLGCAPEVLREAVTRIGALAAETANAAAAAS